MSRCGKCFIAAGAVAIVLTIGAISMGARHCCCQSRLSNCVSQPSASATAVVTKQTPTLAPPRKKLDKATSTATREHSVETVEIAVEVEAK